MPDIALRFHKDMLVLSSPLQASLARQGVDVDRDLEFINLIEPDSVRDALRMELLAGAHCLVAATEGITPVRLAHHGMEDRLADVAAAALAVARALRPQHLVVEVGPCGLPLDASSKSSLNESRDQYARVARVVEQSESDAYLLTGFTTVADLKCALMGIRQVSDRPVLASVAVGSDGTLASGRGTAEEAARAMADLGASAAGFSTPAPLDDACAVAKTMRAACDLPLLAQLQVGCIDQRQGAATQDNPYYCADTMVAAAQRLQCEGVQFLRATGAATPAYTGALAAVVSGRDVRDLRRAL